MVIISICIHRLICKIVLKSLKFTLNFNLFFTSNVHYMLPPIWSSSDASKIAVDTATLSSVTSLNTFYVPTCCMSVTCNNNCVSVSRMEYVGVSHNALRCVLPFTAGWFLLACSMQVLRVFVVCGLQFICGRRSVRQFLVSGTPLGAPDQILSLSFLYRRLLCSCRAPTLMRGRFCNWQWYRWLVRAAEDP